MKRLLMSCAVCILFLTACGSTADTAVVNTEGSTSMADIIAVLQESFHTEDTSITVNFSGTGSGAGIESVLTGTCDIGLSSRPVRPAELQRGAAVHIIALDGIALIVNLSNPVTDLTIPQIASVFTGQITNWKTLGGPDAPIAVYGREAGSGTRTAFEELIGAADNCLYTNEYGSTGDVTGNVSTNPNAIGYASLASVNDTVSILKVNGIACTERTIQNGAYSLQRPFIMVTNQNTVLSKPSQAFLDYALSQEAAPYLSLAGAIPP